MIRPLVPRSLWMSRRWLSSVSSAAAGVAAVASSAATGSAEVFPPPQPLTELPRRRVSVLHTPTSHSLETDLTTPRVQIDVAIASEIAALRAHQNHKIRQTLKEYLGSQFGKLEDGRTASSKDIDTEHSSLQVLERFSSRLQIRRLVTTRDEVEWLDISGHPTNTMEVWRDSIAAALVSLGAHETLVEATLEGVLLPQTTIVEGCQCLVVRCAVEDTSFDMDSIQELTNRLTILVFMKEKRFVTVHRTYMPQVHLLQKRWQDEQESDGAAASIDSLLLYFVKEVTRSFNKALSKSIVAFDGYEARLFAPQRGRSSLARQIYHIKRRASVYSRILALTNDAFGHFIEALAISPNNVYVQDVVQDIAHVRSLSDELNDNANSVLNLLFQLSSYQLNELMRVLTLFSAFFIPLGFIASFYGMNFEGLPGVSDPNGHWYCLTLMAVVGASILLWFKMKKFW